MPKKKDISYSLAFRPFEELSNMINDRWNGLHEKGMHHTEREMPADDQLFKEAMKKVREIKEFRRIPVNAKKVKPPKKEIKESEHVLKILHDIASGAAPISLPDTSEFVEWVNPRMHASVTEQLHSGKYSVQDCIDLHGFTVPEAAIEIDRFIRDSLKRGYGCIKIIHGRGLRSREGSVLKGAVVGWLSGRYRKNVMALVSARQCDGGLGAIYVLLKSR